MRSKRKAFSDDAAQGGRDEEEEEFARWLSSEFPGLRPTWLRSRPMQLYSPTLASFLANESVTPRDDV